MSIVLCVFPLKYGFIIVQELLYHIAGNIGGLAMGLGTRLTLYTSTPS